MDVSTVRVGVKEVMPLGEETKTNDLSVNFNKRLEII